MLAHRHNNTNQHTGTDHSRPWQASSQHLAQAELCCPPSSTSSHHDDAGGSCSSDMRRNRAHWCCCCRSTAFMCFLLLWTTGGWLVSLWQAFLAGEQRGGPLEVTRRVLLSMRARDDAHHVGLGEERRAGGGGARVRVAVCFFGLTRSLRWTLPSIQRRLMDVLAADGVEVDTFVHTYALREVNNKRAGENGIDYTGHAGEYLALNPVRSFVTDQDDFDLAWPDPVTLTHYKWNYRPPSATIRNVFRAYWSMSMAWGLMAGYALEEGLAYDAVVLARPDVWFHVDIDLSRRRFPLPEQTVYLPSFESDRGIGGRKNDRFAYGSVSAMRVMMHRLATLLDSEAGKYTEKIDSEWVVGHHLKMHNITVDTVEFPVTRIRLTGEVPAFDHERVKNACESGQDPAACEMVRLGFRVPPNGFS